MSTIWVLQHRQSGKNHLEVRPTHRVDDLFDRIEVTINGVTCTSGRPRSDLTTDPSWLFYPDSGVDFFPLGMDDYYSVELRAKR